MHGTGGGWPVVKPKGFRAATCRPTRPPPPLPALRLRSSNSETILSMTGGTGTDVSAGVAARRAGGNGKKNPWETPPTPSCVYVAMQTGRVCAGCSEESANASQYLPGLMVPD